LKFTVTTGLIDTKTGVSRGAQDPMEALIALAELPENSVFLLRDIHVFFDDPNPMLIRQLKDQLRAGKIVAQGKGSTGIGWAQIRKCCGFARLRWRLSLHVSFGSMNWRRASPKTAVPAAPMVELRPGTSARFFLDEREDNSCLHRGNRQ
jgi:hypothetical protein